jgi:hypothetical protein
MLGDPGYSKSGATGTTARPVPEILELVGGKTDERSAVAELKLAR